MGTVTTLKIAGLHTSPNELGSVPDGALVQADNVVIRNKDVVEPRRGQEALSYDTGSTLKAMFVYNNTLLVHSSSKLNQDSGSAFTGNLVDSDYGIGVGADTTLMRLKCAEAQQSFYCATSTGVFCIDSLDSPEQAAGVSAALDPYPVSASTPSGLSGNPDATGSWLPVNSRVAYRVVFGRKDANGRLLLGAPSGRLVITNPADVVVPTASLVRNTNVVTATYTDHGFFGGDIVNMTCADANFPNLTNKTLTLSSTSPTSTAFTYADVAANATSANDATFTSGTKKTAFRIPLPLSPSTDYFGYDVFYRVYRSEATLTADTDAVPSDDLYLAYEGTVTATDRVNLYISFTDSTPEGMLGDPLYTNPSTGDGILQSNYRPPLARDIVNWSGRLWFGNTTGPHRLEMQMLGVGSPDGVQANDAVHIAGLEYNAAASISTSYDFKVSTTFTSAPLNTFYTAVDLIRAINLTNTTAYAYYVSGENDVPGKILLESQVLGGSPFYFAAERPASWGPLVPQISVSSAVRTSNVVTVTTGADHFLKPGQVAQLVTFSTGGIASNDIVATITTTPTSTTFTYASVGVNGSVLGGLTYFLCSTRSQVEQSTNDRAANRVYYSKNQQPEAVPLLNYLDVGPRNKAILRLVPLRDKLFVFSEAGIYIIGGDAPFRVDLLDDTIRLLAPDSVVTVGNQIFAFTYQGVVSVSEGGVQIVSRPIENDLLRTALASANLANAKLGTFGVSYESERSYILWLASTSSYPTEAYVYNYLTNTWTRWPIARSCGIVLPSTDRLYTGSPTTATVYRERKAMTRADYRDATSSSTIDLVASLGSGSYQVNLSSTNTLLAVGDIGEGSGWVGRVTNTGSGDFPIVQVTSGTPVTGAVTWSHAYQCTVAWAANPGGNPSIAKHHREASIMFKRRLFYGAYAQFTSDLQQTAGSVELTWTDRSVATSGSLTTRAIPVNNRAIVPQAQQRGSYLQVGFSCCEAYAFFEINGFALETDGASERGNR